MLLSCVRSIDRIDRSIGVLNLFAYLFQVRALKTTCDINCQTRSGSWQIQVLVSYCVQALVSRRISWPAATATLSLVISARSQPAAKKGPTQKANSIDKGFPLVRAQGAKSRTCCTRSERMSRSVCALAPDKRASQVSVVAVAVAAAPERGCSRLATSNWPSYLRAYVSILHRTQHFR